MQSAKARETARNGVENVKAVIDEYFGDGEHQFPEPRGATDEEVQENIEQIELDT